MKLKSYKYFIAILAITTIFSSCSKENNIVDEQRLTKQDETTLKLISFKQELFSKSGGTMLSDSAEWYLEGLLNYEQANNTHEFTQVEFLYDTLAWPSGNGVISYEDIQLVYASVNDLAENMAQQSGSPDYTFDVIDLQVIDLQVIETGLKNGEQVLVVSLSGGLPGKAPTYVGFLEDDYWLFGYGEGKCGDYSGQYIGRDATTELQHHIRFVPTTPSYHVSVETQIALPDEFPASDNPYGYYMIWMLDGPATECLSPDELNYYLSKFDYIKNFKQPAGKTFITVDVNCTFILGESSDYLHFYNLKYGVNIGCPID